MTEEEKEFIKSLKTQCECARKNFKDSCCQLPIVYIEKMINIIEKQQKEIELLKDKNKILQSVLARLKLIL